jgi:hypothetical protein
VADAVLQRLAGTSSASPQQRSFVSIGDVKLSPTARVLLGAGALVGLLAYALVVELGVNAGRIHIGVSVRGTDLGGLTVEEAQGRLVEFAARSSVEKVTFGAAGLDRVVFSPADLNWRPEPGATAEQAAAVGRSGGLLEALRQRVRAYFGGVDLKWAGGPKGAKVSKLIDAIEDRARAEGFELRRAKLRGKIKRVLQSWPRQGWYRIPIVR